jgi:glycosyltransferase involved in cell wall biosynthesis
MRFLLLAEFFPSLHEPLFTGGVESRCYHIAVELSKNNHVTVLTSRQKNLCYNEKRGNIDVFRLSTLEYSSFGNILARLILCFRMFCFLKNLKQIDYVEGCSFLMYVPSFFFGRLIGAKTIITYHELWVGKWIKLKGLFTGIFGELWERFALVLPYDRIHVISESTKKELILYGINDKKVKVIPNGVNSSIFDSFANKNNTPQICYAGRLIKTKNVDTIIRAMPRIIDAIPNVQCVICGDGEERRDLEKLVIELDVKDNVTFLGRLKKYEDVINLMKKSHLFCHPSGVEGFGIVLVESMACGTPIITSDIPPFKELNINGVGLLFKIGDYQKLSQYVIDIFNDKTKYNQMTESCLKMSRQYSWENIAKNYFA